MYALLVFSVIIILIGLLVGLHGLKEFFQFILIGLLVLTLLFGVGYVIYLLFIKREYKDIPAQFKKKLYATIKILENNMLGDLYLSGDYKHNRIKLGKYFYMRLNLPKIVTEEGVRDNTNPKSRTEIVPIDCFIVQRKGLFNRFFDNPFFILVKPEDHDYSAIFNDVTIKGFNLVPLDSEFYTIDRRNLDADMVKGMSLNYIREVVYDLFKDLDRLVKQAINLDQQFQKDKERAREFEIPQIPQIGALQNK